MPTILTFTIKPSGGDYTSMTTCRAANAKNLITADEQHIYEFYTFTGGLNDNDAFVGYTDDATRNIILKVADESLWDGIDPKSGFYFKNTTSSAVIRPISGIQNMELDGICADGSSSTQGVISISNGGDFKSVNNLGFIDVARDNFPSGFSGTVDNTLLINPGDDGGVLSTAVNKLTVVNAGNRGIVTTTGSTITNSFFYGSTGVDFSNQGGSGHDYNATGDGTATGVNSLINRSDADFENFVGLDYRTSATSALASSGSVDFIGYSLAGSGGISIILDEQGPSFTESFNTTLSVNISANISEAGPSFSESVNVDVSSLTIQASIAEQGASFSEGVSATVTPSLSINASISENGPSFIESINTDLEVNISSSISELGPSFSESINLNLTKDVLASITEFGPSFNESINANIPIKITLNPKNLIRVKRKSNTVIIKRKSNIIRVK